MDRVSETRTTGVEAGQERPAGNELSGEFSRLSRRDRLRLFAMTHTHPAILNALNQAMPYLPAVPDALRMMGG